MALLPIHRRFLFLEFGLIAAAVNVAINAVVACVLFLGYDRVPLWSDAWLAGSIATDTYATCFLLPLLFTLIATPPVRRRVASGRLPPLVVRSTRLAWLEHLPRRARMRGLVFALAAAATLGPLTVWALQALGIDGLSFAEFVAFKSLFAGALALAVGPLIGAQALLPAEGE